MGKHAGTGSEAEKNCAELNHRTGADSKGVLRTPFNQATTKLLTRSLGKAMI